MKLYLIAIYLICNLSLAVFTQTVDPVLTGKESSKELKKLEEKKRKEEEKLAKEKEKKEAKAAKDNEKNSKNARQNELNRMTVSLDQLMNFPQNYVGQQLRVTRASFGNPQRYQEGTESTYLLDMASSPVRESGEYYPGVLNTTHVNFTVNEVFAQEMFNYFQDQRQKNISRENSGVGNLIFKVSALHPYPGGPTYYFARVSCIEFLGFFSKITKSIGYC